jgi:hypothetical protein
MCMSYIGFTDGQLNFIINTRSIFFFFNCSLPSYFFLFALFGITEIIMKFLFLCFSALPSVNPIYDIHIYNWALITNIITTNNTIEHQQQQNTNSGNSIFIHWFLYSGKYWSIHMYMYIYIFLNFMCYYWSYWTDNISSIKISLST